MMFASLSPAYLHYLSVPYWVQVSECWYLGYGTIFQGFVVYLRGFRGWFSGDVGGKSGGSGGFGNGYSSVSGEFFSTWENSGSIFSLLHLFVYEN